MQDRNKLIGGAILVAGVFAVTWAVSAPQRGQPNPALSRDAAVVKTITTSAEWKALDSEVDSLDAGYGDAMKKVAEVSDANTREALQKVLACVRDNQKAVKDLRRLVKLVVEREAQ